MQGVMRNSFLVNLCDQLQTNNPALDTLSLISLPTCLPSLEEQALLSKSLAVNSTIRWLELGLDESTTTLDISGLATNTNLHTLVIQITSCDYALDHALHAIGKMSSLHRVELKWIGDVMTTSAAHENIFTQLKRIHCITLSGFRLESSKIEPLSWRELALDGCDLTSSRSLEWLPLCGTHIAKLCISNSRISPESLRNMADNSNSLHILDLSNNSMTENHCDSLCKVLDSSPKLLSLSLADNPQIGDNGMKLLCDTVSHKIQRLDLSNCQISKILDIILDTFPFVEALNLSENPLDDVLLLDDATKLKELVLESMSKELVNIGLLLDRWNSPQSMISLERLDLSGNFLTAKDLFSVGACSCKTLVLAGCQIDDVRLLTLLSSCNKDSWSELHLSYNQIGDQAAEILSTNFRRLQSLRRLSLDNNPLSELGVATLLKAGLPPCLEYFNVWNPQMEQIDSQDQTDIWSVLEAELNHQLKLNRAGKSLLHSKTLSQCLVPWILAEAQTIYGNDALFDFLRNKPDLVVRP